MNLPLILVNFKIYEQGVGARAIELARVHERVARESGKSVGICVSAPDLREVARAVDIPVFAQHVDNVSFGSGTGYVLPELVKDCGAYGTLLNHAEHPIRDDAVLKESILKAKEAGLFTVVCADTPQRAGIVADFECDLIAVEPPELIGGDISVSKAGPEIIEDAVEIVGGERVLVGAGIRDPEDVEIACRLGAQGVLVASGVVKAEDPYEVLSALVEKL